MVALYIITGVISTMFIMVVFMGARRAVRHPERYGRREGNETQSPQTTAGGIAQAILDTFPVIKFNRSTTFSEGHFRGAQPKTISSEGELHSIVLPELNPPYQRRRSSVTTRENESETLGSPSDDNDDSLKGRGTPSGSRRASGSHQTLTEEPEAMDDQCPICLLAFEEGDNLRVLPCEKEHVYHQACIDPWLLDVSGSCPLCRKGMRRYSLLRVPS